MHLYNAVFSLSDAIIWANHATFHIQTKTMMKLGRHLLQYKTRCGIITDLIDLREALPEKNGIMWGKFPSVGSPPVWERPDM